MKKVLILLDCLIVIMGILTFVFSFMYAGLGDSIYRDLLCGSVLLCWASLASADHIRNKSESERLNKFVRRIKH